MIPLHNTKSSTWSPSTALLFICAGAPELLPLCHNGVGLSIGIHRLRCLGSGALLHI